MEQSHRADDEEFYRPYLTTVTDAGAFPHLAARWAYCYNVLRPHLGAGMNERTPLQALRDSGHRGPETIALSPLPVSFSQQLGGQGRAAGQHAMGSLNGILRQRQEQPALVVQNPDPGALTQAVLPAQVFRDDYPTLG